MEAWRWTGAQDPTELRTEIFCGEYHEQTRVDCVGSPTVIRGRHRCAEKVVRVAYCVDKEGGTAGFQQPLAPRGHEAVLFSARGIARKEVSSWLDERCLVNWDN